MALLEVKDLRVSFPTPDGLVQAVRGVTFSVDRGRTLGIVGESGSGKSVATQTVVGLTVGAKVAGQALFEGRDLLHASAEQLRTLRGAEIGMIFQDPMSSLHPYYRVGWQIMEAIRAHEDIDKHAAHERAVALLASVGIPRPEERVDDFPHQFSGGMRQRAMIAMALALDPALLVADEPTTALDVTVQAQILELMQRLQTQHGSSVILITHDLGVVAEAAHDVLIMYAGEVMEQASRRPAFYQPHHPYTVGLLGSLPQQAGDTRRLKSIPGQPPSLINPPPGCPFHPRCPFVMPRCRSEVPPLQPVGGDSTHKSACWLPVTLVGTGDSVDAARTAAAVEAGASRGAEADRQVGVWG